MPPAHTATEMIAAYGLQPHPEGGHYRETYRDAPAKGRGVGTAILFLLAEGEVSHWHRVDAVELWIWQAGAPLDLMLPARTLTLDEAQIHGVVPAHEWQAARSQGAWTLVSCVVMPAFEFTGFELAPPGWSPA
jgi:predicted cupin superfamily sugar epimerase